MGISGFVTRGFLPSHRRIGLLIKGGRGMGPGLVEELREFVGQLGALPRPPVLVPQIQRCGGATQRWTEREKMNFLKLQSR